MRGFRLIVFLVLTLLCAASASAQFGITKDRVSLSVPHPPDIYIPGRQLRVEARSEAIAGQAAAAQLRASLEQELLRAKFDVSSSSPETLIRLVVNQFDTRISVETGVEPLNLHVRFRTEYDKKGRPYQVEDCNVDRARVTRHIARGALSVSLTLEGVDSQTRLAEEVVPAEVNFDAAVAGPKLCAGANYASVSGDFTDTTNLGNYLVQTVRNGLYRRLFGWVEPVEALLAKPDELKPGNRLALTHQWNQALTVWQAASIKKQKTEAYRQYNLGVAYEGLAYDTKDVSQALGHLQNAEKAYSKAMELHPEEKYFPPAFARVNSGRQALERAQEQQAQREREATRPRAEAAEQARPATPPTQVGAPVQPAEEPADVKLFRDYLRMRLSRLGGKLDSTQRGALVQDGVRWGLTAAEAERLVASEEERTRQVRENAERYRDFYRECWEDRTITPEEREQLDIFRKKLNLPDELVAQVENEFQPKPSKPPPPQPKVTPKPAQNRAGS